MEDKLNVTRKLNHRTEIEILPTHIEVQNLHQELLHHHFSKPELTKIDMNESDQKGLFTPNQQYKKQLDELIKKYK